MKWFRQLIRKGELEHQLDAELRFHFERQVKDYIRAGLSEADARRRARLEFGGLEQVKEECRDVRRTAWIDALAQDVRFALRGFGRRPRFALSAIVAIALAVGGATAVFSVVDRSLFRPLPYAFGDRVVSIGIVAPVITAQDWLFAGTYHEWRDSQSTFESQSAFESMTAWKGVTDCDRNDGAPERLGCALVEASFLPTLGVTPVVGRNFAPEEDEIGAEPVAIVSHALSTTRFSGSAAALDKRITIDGIHTRIIGVLPASFETPSLAPADVLVPLRLRKGAQKQRLVQVIGRMRAGLSIESAQAQLAPLFQHFIQTAPADFRKAVPMQLRVATLRDHQTRGYRLALWMLFGAVLSLVLIACANVANLLLARSATRRHEFAVRASLGASRWRLVRQALTESAVLGVVGGGIGCVIAYGSLRLCQILAPEGAMRISHAAIDLRVLAFAIVLSLLTALVFGLAPAVERLRGEVLAAARTVGRARNWLRPALVSVQLSISVVLLTGTGLFLLSLWRLQQTRLGFTPETVVMASFILPEQRYASEERQVAFFNELEQTLERVPGFVSAAITDSLPPGGDPRSRPFVALIGGGNGEERGLEGLVKWRYVTPGYFDTLGIPVRGGRAFSDEDRSSGRQAVIVSESLARRLFGEQDPIGKHLRLEEPCEVVGVVADVRNAGLQTAPDLEFYALRGLVPNGVSRNQRPPLGWRQAIAVVRSTLPNRVAADALQESIRSIDPSVAVVIGSMDGHVRQYFARPRFQTILLSLFAFLGLTLAAVGLYGLISFMVAERARELGVRVALGATPTRIIRMMMAEGMIWTAIGVLFGSMATVGVMRSIRALLFEVEPLDIRAIGTAIAVLVVVALLAILLPSRRAARVDPMQALRQE